MTDNDILYLNRHISQEEFDEYMEEEARMEEYEKVLGGMLVELEDTFTDIFSGEKLSRLEEEYLRENRGEVEEHSHDGLEDIEEFLEQLMEYISKAGSYDKVTVEELSLLIKKYLK